MSAANVTPLRPEHEPRYLKWEPEEFAAANRPASEPAVQQVSAAEPEVRMPTVDEIERMHIEAAEAGRKAGFEHGYEEGTARVRMEALQINTLLEHLETAVSEFDQQVGESLVRLALEIARQVVRRELKTQPQCLLDVVRETLAQLPHQHVSIHVHPDDAQLVRVHLADQVQHGAHRIREDASLARGGCRLDAAGTQVDATVEMRWKRVVESLGLRDDWAPAADARTAAP